MKIFERLLQEEAVSAGVSTPAPLQGKTYLKQIGEQAKQKRLKRLKNKKAH